MSRCRAHRRAVLGLSLPIIRGGGVLLKLLSSVRETSGVPVPGGRTLRRRGRRLGYLCHGILGDFL